MFPMDTLRKNLSRELMEARRNYVAAVERMRQECDRSLGQFRKDPARPDDLHLNVGNMSSDIVRASAAVKLLSQVLIDLDAARVEEAGLAEKQAEYGKDKR